MKNMIVSDYDETLYQNAEQLKINIEAIKKFREQGNIFVLSTARPYQSIKKELDKYDIPVDYLSCSDGSQIFYGNSEYIASCPVDLDAVTKVRELVPAEPIFSFSKQNNHILEMYYKVDGTFSEEQVLDDIKDVLEDYENLDVHYEYIWDDKVILIRRCDASKSTSAEVIADVENINTNRIFTIGDGLNDVPMIRDYNGYAIAGATDEVRAVSLGTCATVSDLITNVSNNKIKVKTR